MGRDNAVKLGLCIGIPGKVATERCGRGIARIHRSPERQNVEQRVEQPVADFLQQIGGPA